MRNDSLCIISRTSHGEKILSVHGNLDFSTASLTIPYVSDSKSASIHKTRVDLSDCEYIDSSGLGFLLMLKEQSQSHDVVLEGMNQQVLEKLYIVNFNHLFIFN